MTHTISKAQHNQFCRRSEAKLRLSETLEGIMEDYSPFEVVSALHDCMGDIIQEGLKQERAPDEIGEAAVQDKALEEYKKFFQWNDETGECPINPGEDSVWTQRISALCERVTQAELGTESQGY